MKKFLIILPLVCVSTFAFAEKAKKGEECFGNPNCEKGLSCHYGVNPETNTKMNMCCKKLPAPEGQKPTWDCNRSTLPTPQTQTDSTKTVIPPIQ